MTGNETTGPACHRETGPAINESLRQPKFTATLRVQRRAPRRHAPWPDSSLWRFAGWPEGLATFLSTPWPATADGGTR